MIEDVGVGLGNVVSNLHGLEFVIGVFEMQGVVGGCEVSIGVRAAVMASQTGAVTLELGRRDVPR